MKGGVDVDVHLGRGLKEGGVDFGCKGLSLGTRDDVVLGIKIGLVGSNDSGSGLDVGENGDLKMDVGESLKRRPIGNRIDQEMAVRSGEGAHTLQLFNPCC